MVMVGLTKVCGVCLLNSLYGLPPRRLWSEPGAKVPQCITLVTRKAGTEACRPGVHATGAFRLSGKAGHLCSTDLVAGFDVLEGHPERPALLSTYSV